MYVLDIWCCQRRSFHRECMPVKKYFYVNTCMHNYSSCSRFKETDNILLLERYPCKQIWQVSPSLKENYSFLLTELYWEYDCSLTLTERTVPARDLLASSVSTALIGSSTKRAIAQPTGGWATVLTLLYCTWVFKSFIEVWFTYHKMHLFECAIQFLANLQSGATRSTIQF